MQAQNEIKRLEAKNQALMLELAYRRRHHRTTGRKPAEFFAHRHIRQQYACRRCETVVTQLDSGSGKTHRATLWAYRSNDFELGPRIIVFDYQTRSQWQTCAKLSQRLARQLVVDDYAGYKPLFTIAGIGGY